METLYHYTHHKALLGILKEGNIKLATASALKTKPIAWLSTDKVFERTALKAIIDRTTKQKDKLTFDQQFKRLGLARIEVKHTKKIHTWAKLKHLAKYKDLSFIQGLEEIGLELGAKPSDWFGSLSPITNDNFIKVEIFNGKKWVLYENENQLTI